MKLNPDTWFQATMAAFWRVVRPLKSKEFMTDFRGDLPATPENVEAVIEQVKALQARMQATDAIGEFLRHATLEIPAIIRDMEQGKDVLNEFEKEERGGE